MSNPALPHGLDCGLPFPGLQRKGEKREDKFLGRKSSVTH
jgi:hypothetical protein